uniref:Fibrinogen C-terminal domain-containing protein n=1 Tax=Sinocyclocheilus grahami TaxID=75366 RepID=A0A672Q4N4_SINGR
MFKTKFAARSCKEIRDKYHVYDDGLYYLISSRGVLYQTFCDMTTAGGGWTLVARVHENNMYGKCTVGDRWSSQQGSDPNRPDGEGTWANTITFGTAEAATSDDYKVFFFITFMVLHELEHWTTASILRYHTENHFLTSHGGNLHGPAIPIVYDTGNVISTNYQYGPNSRGTFIKSVNYSVILLHKASSLIKPTGCHTEHFCIGGGGHFPEAAPKQCGDFTSFDWNGYGTNTEWSASREITEASVLLFYR